MNIDKLRNVYFIGIGGIGMSALARYFRQRGVQVAGYDKARTELTNKLSGEGIDIHYEDNPALADKDADLVVFTPAIPEGHQELTWYRSHNYPVCKRSELLEWITQSLFTIAVAGTHGKTTISTMIAYLLRETGVGCNAFLGGVSVNYGVNYWSSPEKIAVVEADEYDRSFLRLQPDVAVISAMDPDHLDVYGSMEKMEESFLAFASNIKPGGTLLVKHGLKREHDLSANRKFTYSLQNDAADSYARHIVQKQGGYEFDVVTRLGLVAGIRLNIGGMHNVENAVAAITVAQMMDVDGFQIRKAIASFNGVKRRFEYVVRNEQVVYIDDYAHHPEELRTLIESAKRLFPDRKCIIAFQPHLYSRTRDLAEEFAQSLDLADEVILLDIYPAREAPIEGVTSAIIAEKMTNPVHTLLTKEGLLEFVKLAPIHLLITAGAGNIDQLVQPIKEILEHKG